MLTHELGSMRVFDCHIDTEPPETQQLEHRSFETERQLESWLHANPDVILDEPLLIFGRQYRLESGLPDLLALDGWGNVAVIELKRGESGSGSASEETILSQPQNYASNISRYDYEDLNDIYGEYKLNIESEEWNVRESPVIEESLEAAYRKKFGGSIEPERFGRHERIIVLAETITRRTETNARYLNEQGLNVQCVEVQVFTTQPSDPGDGYTLIASRTVVDYPRSKVRPRTRRDYADYSGLILDVRDRILPEVTEELRLDGNGDVSATKSRLRLTSNHPAHPDNVRYEFDPRIEEYGHVRCGIGVYNADTELHEQVYRVLKDHFDSLGLEGANVTNKPTKSQGVVEIRFDVPGSLEEVSEEEIDTFATTLSTLIQHYHSRIVEKFRERPST